LISSAFAGQVHAAAAGRVEFAIGGATLSGPAGQRPIARGAEVNSGDVVRTTDGRVQVRMADGAYISLQPNTEFGIKDYKFAGKADGTESAFYSLLKGTMRTVTGLIGRVNRNRYQVATPTATVGIRGTGGLIQILDDGATLVQGTSGIWFLANPAGSIDVPAGVSGISPADPGQPPKETEAPPTAGPAPLPPEEGYVQGDQTESDGTAVISGAPGGGLVSGSGFAAAIAYGVNSGTSPFVDAGNASAMFNGSGQMTQAVLSGGSLVFEMQSGSHADFGTDGILAWGRWIGQVAVPRDVSSPTQNYNSNQGLHYVVGMPTPSLPLTGTAVAYAMLGATRPTYLDGSTAPGTLTGSLTVDFVKLSIVTNLDIAMPGAGYSVRGTSSIIRSTPFFLGDASTGLSVAGSGTACTCSCTPLVQGFFAGSTAERAGLGYHVRDNSATGLVRDVVGTAAFAK
jgi:hypothetical protein